MPKEYNKGEIQIFSTHTWIFSYILCFACVYLGSYLGYGIPKGCLGDYTKLKGLIRDFLG